MPRISELPLEDAGIEDLMSTSGEVIRWGPLIGGKREVQIEFIEAMGDPQAFLEEYIKRIEEDYDVLGVEGPTPIEDGKSLYKLELEKSENA